MINGFEKIVEERIKKAIKKGHFDNLPCAGKPLDMSSDAHVPDDLRMTYKILKNADCLPPEIELKKEIRKTEDLLAGMEDTAEKYRTLKRLNLLILKLNTVRNRSAEFDVPQRYMEQVAARIDSSSERGKGD
jgi:DnaJ homologue, subfamily C, member 28, conserved domain